MKIFSITYTKINIRITCKYSGFAGRSTTIRTATFHTAKRPVTYYDTWS